MLLGSCLLLLLLLVVTGFGSVLLWCLGLVSMLLVSSMSRTTSHHSSNALVSDFTTGSESHTCCHGAHEATTSKAHTR